MNILDEITQSYVYNGEISLKALNDDIVTIENQIERLEATLNEVRLRKKNPSLLIAKIRDAKIKLSLLKAVYKRESKNTSSGNAMLNMLGTSGKEAKETIIPKTVAEDKVPIPQNFQKSELETIDDKDTTVVKVENINSDVITADNVINGEKCAEELRIVKNEEDDNTEAENTTIPNIAKPESTSSGDMHIVDSRIPDDPAEYSILDSDDTGKMDMKNPVTAEKDKDDGGVCCSMNADKEPQYEPYMVSKEEYTEDTNSIKLGEETYDNDCPPPTIEDYREPTAYQSIKELAVNGNIEDFATFNENNMEDSTVDELKCYEDTAEETNDAFNTYKPFALLDYSKIYASLDLCDYTDKVNTDFIDANINLKNRTIELTFNDNRDYDIFLTLLNEKNDISPLKRVLKKSKSIFMYVCRNTVNEDIRTKFEFTNCKVKELRDSTYMSRRCALKQENVEHPFFVVFKYKKLKIS